MSTLNKTSSLNLVFDLDDTLLHTHGSGEVYGSIVSEMMNYDRLLGDDDILYNHTLIRPYAFNLISNLRASGVNIIVWSAGVRKYVEEMVEILFGDEPPLLILAREDTDIDEVKGIIVKDLSKIFNSPLAEIYNVRVHNTLVVDDRVDTFSRNESNGILIPKFGVERDMSEWALSDTRLVELDAFIRNIRGGVDVRLLNKANIFTK
jgi:hypothetical protein